MLVGSNQKKIKIKKSKEKILKKGNQQNSFTSNPKDIIKLKKNARGRA